MISKSTIATLFSFFLSLNFINSQSCSDGSYSWDDDIAVILAPCAGCHGGTDGLFLDTYAGISAGGNDCADLLTGTTLVSKITTGGCGGGAMNASCGGCIDATELAAIQAWIDDGAQEVCPTTVPVELSFFELRNENSFIQLLWATSSEVNSDEFIIYHSLDGENFENIGHVYAAGNSNAHLEYSFLHYPDHNGEHFYKILSKDLNGETYFTDVISTRYQSGNFSSDFSIHPNPTNGIINLSFNNLVPEKLKILIYNSQGQLMKKSHQELEQKSIALDLLFLNKGVYHLCVEMDGRTFQRKRFVRI